MTSYPLFCFGTLGGTIRNLYEYILKKKKKLNFAGLSPNLTPVTGPSRIFFSELGVVRLRKSVLGIF